MTQRYNIHHPEHYPVGWLTAATIAAGKREEADPWVSVDWARGEHGAIARMKRLRAFREGLYKNSGSYPEVAKAIAAGYELGFRKRPFQRVWDVQLAWRLGTGKTELLETLREVTGDES